MTIKRQIFSKILLFTFLCHFALSAEEAQETPKEEPPKTYKWIAPDFANVKYGPHERNIFDLWKAKTSYPAPLLIYFHGDDFMKGDKREVGNIGIFENYIESGIAVASMNYRFVTTAPFPAPMQDAALGLQFIRFHAKEYGIDPARIACAGTCSGAGISQWLGFHADLANPNAAEDPVARQSTRISAIGAIGMQSTYDARQVRKVVRGNLFRQPIFKKAFGLSETFHWDFETVKPETEELIKECSPISLLKADAPPIFILHYARDKNEYSLRHPNFGDHIEARLQELGVPYVRKKDFDFRGTSSWDELAAFMKEQLLKK